MFILQVSCPYCKTLHQTTFLLFKYCDHCHNIFRVNLDQANLVYGCYKLFKRKRKLIDSYNYVQLHQRYEALRRSLVRRLVANGGTERKCLQIAGFTQSEFKQTECFSSSHDFKGIPRSEGTCLEK